MRSRFSSLHVVFAIAIAILCGAATYVVAIWIANPSSHRDVTVTERTGVLESQLKSPNRGPPLHWTLKTTDLTIGEPGQITLKLEVQVGAGAELPPDLTASAETTSRGFILTGPDIETSGTAHSWTWPVIADNPGPHEVTVTVDSADGAYRNTYHETLAAHEHQNRFLRMITTGNTLLNALAGMLATVITILTSVGAIIAMGRKLRKPPAERVTTESLAGDDHLSSDRGAGGGRGAAKGCRQTHSAPKRQRDSSYPGICDDHDKPTRADTGARPPSRRPGKAD